MSGVSIGNGVSADPTYPFLDCRDTSASITLPTTPTVWVLPTIAGQNGIDYNTSTGIVTLHEGRTYTVFTYLNVHVTTTISIYAYAEANFGSGWVPIQYSGRRAQVNANIDGQVLTVSRNYFPANTQLRFSIFASGTAVAQTTDIPNTTPGTLTCPAARLMIAG